MLGAGWGRRVWGTGGDLEMLCAGVGPIGPGSQGLKGSCVIQPTTPHQHVAAANLQGNNKIINKYNVYNCSFIHRDQESRPLPTRKAEHFANSPAPRQALRQAWRVGVLAGGSNSRKTGIFSCKE